MRFAKRTLAAILLCFGVATQGCLAAEPAMRASVGHDVSDAGLEESFRSFARSWMDRALARAQRNQIRPRAQGGTSLGFVYRGVAQDYDIALEPTGNANSPYVGVLRYTEQIFQCRDARGAECTLAASQPVSEVFRFRKGRWSY